MSVLLFYHELACGRHFGPRKIAEKVLQSGLYWPTLYKDAFEFCKTCPRCQMARRISKQNMMPLNPILEIELFDVWGIDFMGPFPNSFGDQYILIVVDNVSKWVEAIPSKTINNKVVVKFSKENIFSHFEPLEPSLAIMVLISAIDLLKLLCRNMS